MASIVITNNGHSEAKPEIKEDAENGIAYQAAQSVDKNIIISAKGFEKVLKPGECVGLDPRMMYTVRTE